jgi:glucose/arabinose dehydrogenase
MNALPTSLRPRLTLPRQFGILLNILLVAALLLPVLPAAPANAQGGFNLPYGFIQDTVVLGLDRPTSFALLPDGRILIAEKSGVVRVAVNGQLLPDPFIDISTEVNDSSDRGLLGIAVHPDWPNTPYVYLAHTYDPPEIKDRNPAGARVSRVVRLSADPNNLNVALPGSGVVLLGTNSTAEHVGNPDQGDTEPFTCFDDAGGFVRDCIAAEGTAHSLDYVKFGPDGALYVSSGDGIVNSKGNSRALNPDSLNGKILRINPITGEGYPDNPFFDGDPNSNRSKVFAMGMRNPFRFTIDPRDGQVIVGDVGNSNWEEINRGGGGSNFGWPCYEGPFEAATYANCDAYKSGAAPVTQAVFSYPHSVKPPMRGSAIGGDIYLDDVFPALYRGAYFYHDFNGGVVNFLTFNADGSANDNEFATNVPGVVQMTVGDDGAMYVISIILGGIWRIRYAPGGNKPPAADAAADPMGGAAPLDVTFSSKRSTDPEKSIVGYRWDFGDGATSSKANPTHTFTENGVYTVQLTVTDSAGATASDTLEIAVGSGPPVAEILEPGNGAKFRIGDTVNFNGKATDAEDGDLTGANLRWTVTLHHLEHLHYDYFNGEGETGSFRFDDHGDDTYLELCLTATDAQGLEDTECVDLKAQEVTYTFNTVPSGLPITYGGSRYETPFKVKTYINASRIVEAPAEAETDAEGALRFDSWSDGTTTVNEAVHEIAIADGNQTWTATYVDAAGAVAGDPAAEEALAAAPLVTPEDTGTTTGSGAHGDDGHEHDAAAEAEAAAEVGAESATEPAPATGADDGGSAGASGAPVIAERWNGVGGTTVEELTKSEAYRKQAPATEETLESLALPRTGDKDYGVRVRGYLVPPIDGEYRFWIAADDRGVLFLSTDASPANKIVVAFTPQSTAAGEYEKNPEQITGPIALEAGKRYYFEVLYKQGDGKDNLSVAWQIPGGARAVIEKEYLEGYQP